MKHNFFLQLESPLDLLLVVILDEDSCTFAQLEYGTDLLDYLEKSETHVRVELQDLPEKLLRRVYEWERKEGLNYKKRTVCGWAQKLE